MYRKIMVPVDLGHLDRMERALGVAADLAKLYGAPVVYVGVTGVQPSPTAHSPEEFEGKLASFAANQASARGVAGEAHALVAHDPAVELDRQLLHAAEEIGADLIVAATHVPSFFGGASHGGALATHSTASVLLVRPD